MVTYWGCTTVCHDGVRLGISLACRPTMYTGSGGARDYSIGEWGDAAAI
jgi:hypothetical protein